MDLFISERSSLWEIYTAKNYSTFIYRMYAYQYINKYKKHNKDKLYAVHPMHTGKWTSGWKLMHF